MTTEQIDLRRRRILLATTTALGAVGIGAAAAPFIMSMMPSARAQAAGGPVQVDIGKLEMGQMLTVEWRGKPIWVLRRSAEVLERLGTGAVRNMLVDPDSRVTTQQPDYAQNSARSIKPEYLVAIGLCTHLGCVPNSEFTPGNSTGLGKDWPGGYFCPCHGSKFDLAGRVFKNVPAPTNLVIPPHRYLPGNIIEIGVDTPA